MLLVFFFFQFILPPKKLGCRDLRVSFRTGEGGRLGTINTCGAADSSFCAYGTIFLLLLLLKASFSSPVVDRSVVISRQEEFMWELEHRASRKQT